MNANLPQVLAAPLQGVTDSVWRSAHATVFGGVNAYYAPFLRVERCEVRWRELRDVQPQRNTGVTLVPQILGGTPEAALMMVNELVKLGYRHIDINLGCPFPPLASHRKGAGLLPHPQLVQELFVTLAGVPDVTYSVKMRLGWDDAAQWRDILPLMSILHPCHVTVHPRTGKQQYKGELLMEQMDALVAQAQFPIVYNGELHTIADIVAIAQRYPGLAAVMVGRGLAANPAMMSPHATADDYRRFHDLLLQGYDAQLNGGDTQLVRRMQAVWEYFLPDIDRRQRKAIAKARTMDAYQTAAAVALASRL